MHRLPNIQKQQISRDPHGDIHQRSAKCKKLNRHIPETRVVSNPLGYAAKGHEIEASKRLGHSQPSTTLDVYGHLYHELQNDAARIMDELVTPIPVELSEKVGIEVT